MLPIASLLLALTVSLLVTRVASVALAHTGLSRQSARFQARSAFTGVGFTTTESEQVVNHPVRRRILMTLMLLGNAGIVTVVSSLILAFLNQGQQSLWWLQMLVLVAGISALWTAASSQWLDRRLERLIRSMLKRYTDMDVRDYANLLHLGGDYQISELHVDEESWLADKTLMEMRLREEGVIILGIQVASGEYRGVPNGDSHVKVGDTLLAYGRESGFERLAERRRDWSGEQDHHDAVVEQRHEEEKQAKIEANKETQDHEER